MCPGCTGHESAAHIQASLDCKRWHERSERVWHCTCALGCMKDLSINFETPHGKVLVIQFSCNWIRPVSASGVGKAEVGILDSSQGLRSHAHRRKSLAAPKPCPAAQWHGHPRQQLCQQSGSCCTCCATPSHCNSLKVLDKTSCGRTTNGQPATTSARSQRIGAIKLVYSTCCTTEASVRRAHSR